jgi:hypothetical protein
MTLDKPFNSLTDGTIKITISARLKAKMNVAGYIYDIGFYTKYTDGDITEPANYPRFFFPPPLNFAGLDWSTVP